jgi:hypothetical protein
MSWPARTAARIREKNVQLWLPGYTRHWLRRRRPRPDGPRHVLFALCDHFEPLWGGASHALGRDRVARWLDGYPLLARQFRDASGRPPRHTFFFPGEQYHPEFLDGLARLVRSGHGEVEIHLHHDGDTVASLREQLEAAVTSFARSGHISRDRSGRHRYAFIHGNWCLANARRDGRYCGVDAELPLLWETGCYADFTFPAAPDESQPRIVNQIYWPTGDLSRRRAYDTGEPAQVGAPRRDRLLIIQGPLAPARRRGRLLPRIETGDLHGRDPADRLRVRTWIDQEIGIAGRPEWIFVKVHTHGAPEKNAPSLLGEGGLALHRELTGRYNDGRRHVLHYVTAREMYNIAMAAICGETGDPEQFRDYQLPPPAAAA